MASSALARYTDTNNAPIANDYANDKLEDSYYPNSKSSMPLQRFLLLIKHPSTLHDYLFTENWLEDAPE